MPKDIECDVFPYRLFFSCRVYLTTLLDGKCRNELEENRNQISFFFILRTRYFQSYVQLQDSDAHRAKSKQIQPFL